MIIKEQLIIETDFYHIPSIMEPGTKLSLYTFMGFNKVGNCIWKPKNGLKETEFTLTFSYSIIRFNKLIN